MKRARLRLPWLRLRCMYAHTVAYLGLGGPGQHDGKHDADDWRGRGGAEGVGSEPSSGAVCGQRWWAAAQADCTATQCGAY